MKEFEVKFIKNEKEIDYFPIYAENIEKAKETALELINADAVWSDNIEIKVVEEF